MQRSDLISRANLVKLSWEIKDQFPVGKNIPANHTKKKLYKMIGSAFNDGYYNDSREEEFNKLYGDGLYITFSRDGNTAYIYRIEDGLQLQVKKTNGIFKLENNHKVTPLTMQQLGLNNNTTPIDQITENQHGVEFTEVNLNNGTTQNPDINGGLVFSTKDKQVREFHHSSLVEAVHNEDILGSIRSMQRIKDFDPKDEVLTEGQKQELHKKVLKMLNIYESKKAKQNLEENYIVFKVQDGPRKGRSYVVNGNNISEFDVMGQRYNNPLINLYDDLENNLIEYVQVIKANGITEEELKFTDLTLIADHVTDPMLQKFPNIYVNKQYFDSVAEGALKSVDDQMLKSQIPDFEDIYHVLTAKTDDTKLSAQSALTKQLLELRKGFRKTYKTDPILGAHSEDEAFTMYLSELIQAKKSSRTEAELAAAQIAIKSVEAHNKLSTAEAKINATRAITNKEKAIKEVREKAIKEVKTFINETKTTMDKAYAVGLICYDFGKIESALGQLLKMDNMDDREKRKYLQNGKKLTKEGEKLYNSLKNLRETLKSAAKSAGLETGTSDADYQGINSMLATLDGKSDDFSVFEKESLFKGNLHQLMLKNILEAAKGANTKLKGELLALKISIAVNAVLFAASVAAVGVTASGVFANTADSISQLASDGSNLATHAAKTTTEATLNSNVPLTMLDMLQQSIPGSAIVDGSLQIPQVIAENMNQTIVDVVKTAAEKAVFGVQISQEAASSITKELLTNGTLAITGLATAGAAPHLAHLDKLTPSPAPVALPTTTEHPVSAPAAKLKHTFGPPRHS